MNLFLTFAPPKFIGTNNFFTMYAIVDIAGQQFRVEKSQKIFVHRLEAEEGSQVEFNEVLLVDRDGSSVIGKPFVDGAKISAKILSHMKGDKVLVFKKTRRKGFQKQNGHRQYMSEILIEEIIDANGPVEATAKTRKPRAKKEKPAEN